MNKEELLKNLNIVDSPAYVYPPPIVHKALPQESEGMPIFTVKFGMISMGAPVVRREVLPGRFLSSVVLGERGRGRVLTEVPVEGCDSDTLESGKVLPDGAICSAKITCDDAIVVIRPCLPNHGTTRLILPRTPIAEGLRAEGAAGAVAKADDVIVILRPNELARVRYSGRRPPENENIYWDGRALHVLCDTDCRRLGLVHNEATRMNLSIFARQLAQLGFRGVQSETELHFVHGQGVCPVDVDVVARTFRAGTCEFGLGDFVSCHSLTAVVRWEEYYGSVAVGVQFFGIEPKYISVDSVLCGYNDDGAMYESIDGPNPRAGLPIFDLPVPSEGCAVFEKDRGIQEAREGVRMPHEDYDCDTRGRWLYCSGSNPIRLLEGDEVDLLPVANPVESVQVDQPDVPCLPPVVVSIGDRFPEISDDLFDGEDPELPYLALPSGECFATLEEAIQEARNWEPSLDQFYALEEGYVHVVHTSDWECVWREAYSK